MYSLPYSTNCSGAGLLARLGGSLVSKVTLMIGLASLSLACMFALTTTPFIQEHEEKRQISLIGDLLSTVESTVRIACFAEDKTLATEVARGLMTNKTIAGIHIISSGQTLTKLGKPTTSEGKAKRVTRAVSSPFDQQSIIGEIVVTTDADYIRDHAIDYSMLIIGMLLFEVIAATGLVAFLILRTVVRPITHFAKELEVEQTGIGRRLRPPQCNRHDEIGRLAAAFNRMIERMAGLLDKANAMREEVAVSELRFRTLVENSPDIIARYDDRCRLVFANPAYALETAMPLERMPIGKAATGQIWRPTMPLAEYNERLRQVIDSGTPDRIHLEWKNPTGDWVYHEIYVVPEHGANGEAMGALAIGRNISALKRIEQQLLFQATHDPLTGLPNRVLLKDRLHHALLRSIRHGRSIAVIFIDLDNFKDINDRLGHDIGDELLKLLAKRMCQTLRESDTVARLGGDEFVVFIEDKANAHDLDNIVQKLFNALSEPCLLSEHRIYPGASLGIALSPNDGTDVDTLMRNADTAMYVAKREGRNHYRFFSAEMDGQLREWIEISDNLRHAIANGELSLHYQPKAHLKDGSFAGMEALIRWHNPKLGWVSPTRFIPVAEKCGLINGIGHWVLNEACRQMRDWLDQGIDPLCVAVNLSAKQCQPNQLPVQIREILDAHELPGHRLEVEITESILMVDTEGTIRDFWALRDLGVRVAVDDFGTGYSSLSYLKRLPVDKLKIDKSFVDDIETDRADVEIIRAIIAMAHSLNLEVIAEGVENALQFECLRLAGCDQIQGYYFSRPLAADAMATMLEKAEGCPNNQDLLSKPDPIPNG